MPIVFLFFFFFAECQSKGDWHEGLGRQLGHQGQPRILRIVPCKVSAGQGYWGTSRLRAGRVGAKLAATGKAFHKINFEPVYLVRLWGGRGNDPPNERAGCECDTCLSLHFESVVVLWTQKLAGLAVRKRMQKAE